MHDSDLDYKRSAHFCAKIGQDSLFCQGAGGNYSWKSNNQLFIKASGMWLSDSLEKNIFVGLDRQKYLVDLLSNDFQVDLALYTQDGLKPSIETSMHALLPQKYIIHLHPIQILAVLIQKNWRAILEEIVADKYRNFSLIEYHKPGQELAKAIDTERRNNPNSNIYFLKNHGVIIAGDDFDTFQKFVHDTLSIFSNRKPKNDLNRTSELCPSDIPDYLFFRHPTITALLSRKIFRDVLEKNWRLYPDHLVFMGMQPIFFPDQASTNSALPESTGYPPIFFHSEKGCYLNKNHTQAQLAQLKCYFDVLENVDYYENIESLTIPESLDLLNWDAEKYRLSLQK